MQAVGHHLQVKAHRMRAGDASKDSFARSAYNRYYYACFLCTRAALAEINPEWSMLQHSRYPIVFKKDVRQLFAAARKKAAKISDTELMAKIDAASRAAIQVSDIMTQAYGARVVADYQPGVPVQFVADGRFSLSGIDITRAHNWEGSINSLIASILSAWRHINA